MTERGNRRDFWRWPALLLWLLFLLAGLLPEEVFFFLKDLGRVPMQRAIVNQPMALTVAMSLYMSLFTLLRCREGGCSEAEAEAKALHVGIVSLVAFLPGIGMLLLSARHIPQAQLRHLVYGVATAKGLAWLYLLGLVCRYYALNDRRVFARMKTPLFVKRWRGAQNAKGDSSDGAGGTRL